MSAAQWNSHTTPEALPLWPSIVFGFFGAYFQASKADRLGLPTKRYWLAAFWSTAITIGLGILLPVLLLGALAASFSAAVPDEQALATANDTYQPSDGAVMGDGLTEEPGEGVSDVAPVVTTRSGNFTFAGHDGTIVTASLTLSDVVPATEEASVIAAAGRQITSRTITNLPCATEYSLEPTRDALLYGTIGFTNDTPDFAPDAQLLLDINTPNYEDEQRLTMGVIYGADDRCFEDDSYNFGRLNPNFESAAWGPVPFVITVKNYYSPAQPEGDKALLRDTTVSATGILTTTGNVTAADGMATFLRNPPGIPDQATFSLASAE